MAWSRRICHRLGPGSPATVPVRVNVAMGKMLKQVQSTMTGFLSSNHITVLILLAQTRPEACSVGLALCYVVLGPT